jgi:predicted membrane protein
MKKTKNFLWGIVFIVIGVLWILNVCEVITGDLLFEGWWTLFIMVPCAIGLVTERDKFGNLIGLGIGVCLLLGTRDIVDFSLLWKLVLPVIVVLIGVRIIFGNFIRSKKRKHPKTNTDVQEEREHSAVFFKENVNYDGKVFEGAELTAVCGGIKCDLRGAIINHDVTVEINAIFGGVDLLLPADVNVQLSTVSIFGSTSDKHGSHLPTGTVTVFVESTCVFGGTEIK